MAKKLAENNHQVWIITNKIEGEIYSFHKNIKIIFVPPVLKYQGGLPPSIKDNIQYFLNSTKAGIGVIRKNNIDIIHSNNFTPAFAGSFISFLMAKNHITSIWDIFTLCGCDYWEKWVKQTGVSKINQFIGPIFEKLILKIKCDAFHTISNASKDDLIKFGAKKPIYIIDPTIDEASNENTPQNNKQFIFVGRAVFYKNIEVLINAMKLVKDKNIKLIIVGGGPQLETIQNIVNELHLQDNIIIKGYLDTKEKLKLIAESNAMLFPSMCEGFGLVILEAFQQKRPVLVSNIPPMSDIVEDGKTGFVLNPKDESVWAEKIIYFMNNPNDADIMGNNGYSVLKQKYNQELFYKNIINMYKSVLNRK